MAWSRRRFVKLLSSIPAGSVFPFLSHPATTQAHRQVTPGISRSTSFAASPAPAGKHSRLGYKMICWDLQFMDTDPNTLKYADAEKYADAVARAGADSHLVYAMTNTGLALFKSQFLPKFRNLPDDFLGAYFEACRKRGIKTELYYSLGWQKTLDVEHPDWQVLDANGKPVQENGGDEESLFLGAVSHLCFNSPFREYCLKEVKELADRYTFDFWDIDILLWWGRKMVCYNPYCIEKWKARTGQDLPHPLPQELYPTYLDFVADTYRSIYQAIKDQLKASGREVPTTHNYGFLYDLDDFVMIESNPGGSDFYNMSVAAKVYRAHAHGREVQINPHRANNYVDYVNAPLPTLTWESAVAVSHNAGQMWCDMANIDGRLDEMAVRSMKEVFRVVDRLAPKIQGTVPYAEIAVLFSERDHILVENMQQHYDAADFRGAHKLLTDLHWPFDVVADEHLSVEDLSGSALLIVPSLQYLAKEHRQMVLEYLEKGGHVFFCGRCAVLDRDGRPHREPEFGLVKVRETQQLHDYVKTVFPIKDERLKTARVATVEPDPSLTVLGKLIQMSAPRREGSSLGEPPFPLYETDLPVIVTGRKGRGQFAYVGYALFREYLKQGLPVIGEAFTKIVADFYRPSVWVEAPTVVEAIYNRVGNEMRVSLVNGITTRPTADGYVNIVEVIPIMGTRIVVIGKKVLRAVDLEGRDVPMATEGPRTVVSVPRLDQYELVSLEVG